MKKLMLFLGILIFASQVMAAAVSEGDKKSDAASSDSTPMDQHENVSFSGGGTIVFAEDGSELAKKTLAAVGDSVPLNSNENHNVGGGQTRLFIVPASAHKSIAFTGTTFSNLTIISDLQINLAHCTFHNVTYDGQVLMNGVGISGTIAGHPLTISRLNISAGILKP